MALNIEVEDVFDTLFKSNSPALYGLFFEKENEILKEVYKLGYVIGEEVKNERNNIKEVWW